MVLLREILKKIKPFYYFIVLAFYLGAFIYYFLQVDNSTNQINKSLDNIEKVKLDTKLNSLVSDFDNLRIRYQKLLDNNLLIDSSNIKNDNISLLLIKSKVDSLAEIQNGLRQAINPKNPEEILTIARLKDDILEIKKHFADFEENFKARQLAFEESVRRENANSNQSTSLFLVVLIPLVLNFLYTVWKDFKDGKKDSKKADL